MGTAKLPNITRLQKVQCLTSLGNFLFHISPTSANNDAKGRCKGGSIVSRTVVEAYWPLLNNESKDSQEMAASFE